MIYYYSDIMKKVKEFLNKYLIWIVLIIALFLFLFIVRAIFSDSIKEFDNAIYNYVKVLINPKLTFVMRIITELGNYFVMIPIIIIFYIFNKDKSFNKYFTINLVAVFVSNVIVKNIIGRTRPSDINLIIETGFSFPSGHSMVSFAFYGFLAYYIYHIPLAKSIRYLLICLCALIIFLIGFSRIYLGVHYASDVIGGFLLAIVYLILFINFIYKREEKKKELL